MNLIDASTQSMTGGKASNLTILTNAGFKVPPGFVVTTEAYSKFIVQNELENLAKSHLVDIDHENAAELQKATRIMREHIAQASLPKEVVDAVTNSYQQQALSRVAIRSSATAEDLPDASFAGQYDTSLNIEGIQNVLEHIKSCFGSMWTTRAVAYREENEIPHDQVQVAVIVQTMVDARCAGVMFTMNPISRNRNEMMIESNFGLGESVVSGQTVPDRYVVAQDQESPTGYTMVTKEIGTKESIVIKNTSGIGVQESGVSAEKRQQSSLEDDEILNLAKLGKSIEELFQAPQDIEWGLDREGKIHILQSRPITVGLERDDEEEEVFWTRGYADDYWNDPVTPLFYDLLGDQITYIVNVETNAIMGYKDTPEQLLKLHKGHVYFNLDVLRTKVVNEMPPFIRSEDVLNYFPEGGGPFGKDTMRELPFALKTRIMAEIRVMLFDGDGGMTKTNDVYVKWTEDVFNPYCKRFDMDLSHASQHESTVALMTLADDLDKVMMKHFRMVRYGLPVHTLGMNLITNYLLRRWVGEKAAGVMYPILLSGLEHKTTETNNRIFELAELASKHNEIKDIFSSTTSDEVYSTLVESESPAVTAFMEKFNGFIDDFGDRGFTREVYYPRWRDNPTYVIDALKPLVVERMRNLSQAGKSLTKKRNKAEDLVEQHIRSQRYGPIKWMLFSTILAMARTYIGFRENQRFNLDRWITRNRGIFLEIGNRLHEQSFIDEPNDIFFLQRKEIRSIVRGGIDSTPDKEEARKNVKERKENFLKYENILPPKFMVGSREFDDPLPDSAEGFVGIPASQGRVTGVVRILERIEDIPTVKAGEIVVVSRTDPGWTPVFSKIGGLITESGGVLSHGAVVSREFGIPAVTNVRNACSVFENGQRVTLDGSEGRVILHEQE
ncbi:MAG: PEP/pyruvate-binding domain-containing protein [Candidatus Thorarchaeota archaeon]